MNDTDQNISRKSGVLKLFTNPYIGILGSVASIIGVFIAIYFWHVSKRYRELVYFIHPAKAVVVKTGQTSKLKYFFENNEIQCDVTAVQMAIWNQGSEPIKLENILSKVIISTTPPVPILDAIIRKKSRDVVNIILDQSSERNGTIPLTWNILEKGDGILIQIIYAGDPNIMLSLKGVIEGQTSIKEIKYSGSILSPADQISEQKNTIYWNMYGLLFLSILLTILFIISKNKFADNAKTKRKRPMLSVDDIQPYVGNLERKYFVLKRLYYASFIIVLLFIVSLIIYFFYMKLPEPPFGF